MNNIKKIFAILPLLYIATIQATPEPSLAPEKNNPSHATPPSSKPLFEPTFAQKQAFALRNSLAPVGKATGMDLGIIDSVAGTKGKNYISNPDGTISLTEQVSQPGKNLSQQQIIDKKGRVQNDRLIEITKDDKVIEHTKDSMNSKPTTTPSSLDLEEQGEEGIFVHERKPLLQPKQSQTSLAIPTQTILTPDNVTTSEFNLSDIDSNTIPIVGEGPLQPKPASEYNDTTTRVATLESIEQRIKEEKLKKDNNNEKFDSINDPINFLKDAYIIPTLVRLLFEAPQKAPTGSYINRSMVWSALTRRIADNLGLTTASTAIAAQVKTISDRASKKLDKILGAKDLNNSEKTTRINQLITNVTVSLQKLKNSVTQQKNSSHITNNPDLVDAFNDVSDDE